MAYEMNKHLWHQASAGALALSLLAACETWSEATGFPPAQLTEKGTIFSAKLANSYTQHLRLSAPYWTPTVGQIEKLEEKLPGYLRDSGAWQVDEVLSKLDTYRYQYIGYSNAGRKMIWVNGFCPYGREIDPIWQNRPLLIADGGPCFFKVHYDPATETFERLFVHGPA